MKSRKSFAEYKDYIEASGGVEYDEFYLRMVYVQGKLKITGLTDDDLKFWIGIFGD